MSKSKEKKDTGFVSVEVFAAAVGVFLIILFFVITVVSGIEEKKPDINNLTQIHKLSWPDGSVGKLILILQNHIKIFETDKKIAKNNICKNNSPFINFAKNTYKRKKEILIFVITEGSMPVATVTRNCLRSLFPKKPTGIGWIIANNSLLKIKSLNDLPRQ